MLCARSVQNFSGKENHKNNLIIINITHISMFRNYSFNFGWNVTKRGRNMERRRERNIAEPKFELKSFRPSSCIFTVAAISKR